MYAHVYHLSFFLLFLLFFKSIYEGKLIQNRTMAERKYLEICMQPRDAGTHKRVHSRTVKIGCISFMKILLCIAGGAQWIYLVHLPHRSDLLYYCTSCLRLIFRQTCIFRENENACADRKF